MKKILLLLAISSFGIAFAQKKTTTTKPYFPSASQWEKKSANDVGMDSILLEKAIQFAVEHETKVPKDQEMAQIVNFYKEPFSDAVGPFATRKSSSGVIIRKGYIISSWGDIDYSEQTNSVTKSFLSVVVGLAVDKGLIRSIDDKVGDYVQLIEPYDPETYRKPEDLGKSHFIMPFASEHNKKITWNHMLRQTSDWEGTLWGKPDWADRPNDKTQEW
ncbi:MAG: hypothetical protein RL152_316, partial [Bacteroidota bacterium]